MVYFVKYFYRFLPIPLSVPLDKVLALGNEKKNKFSFCIITRLSVPLDKVLSLGNEKKNKFSFCISLVYPYLCNEI